MLPSASLSTYRPVTACRKPFNPIYTYTGMFFFQSYLLSGTAAAAWYVKLTWKAYELCQPASAKLPLGNHVPPSTARIECYCCNTVIVDQWASDQIRCSNRKKVLFNLFFWCTSGGPDDFLYTFWRVCPFTVHYKLADVFLIAPPPLALVIASIIHEHGDTPPPPQEPRV